MLVLPGFTASDQSTRPLRGVLRRKGYSVHGWGLGANVGPHPHVLEGMERRLAELVRAVRAKVSLVGWSLGGIYARELGTAPGGRDSSSRWAVRTDSAWVIAGTRRSCTTRWLHARAVPGRLVPEEERTPPQAYRRRRSTRRPTGSCGGGPASNRSARCENIAVLGTHNGLGCNVGALRDHRPAQPAARDVDTVRATAVPAPNVPADISRGEQPCAPPVQHRGSGRIGGSPLTGAG